MYLLIGLLATFAAGGPLLTSPLAAFLLGAVGGLSFFAAGTLTVITAFSQHSLILVIFKLSFSTSTKKEPIAFSPTNFIKVPIASAEQSLTVGSTQKKHTLKSKTKSKNNIAIPGSLMFFIKAVVIAFSNFLFKAVGRVLVNDLAKKEAVSDLTEGFLLFKASITSSTMASKVVYKKKPERKNSELFLF